MASLKRASRVALHDVDAVGVLREIDDFAPAPDRDVRIARQRVGQRRFEIRLIEEIDDRPAERSLARHVLRDRRAVGAHELHRRFHHHARLQFVGHRQMLENPHAFVVGINSAGITVKHRFALEHDDAVARLAEQVCEHHTGRPQPHDRDVARIVLMHYAHVWSPWMMNSGCSSDANARRARPSRARNVRFSGRWPHRLIPR